MKNDDNEYHFPKWLRDDDDPKKIDRLWWVLFFLLGLPVLLFVLSGG